MDKALTFEEWWPRVKANGGHEEHKSLCEEVWKWARKGMIPADRAIEIPDVSEWPEWAQTIIVGYSPTIAKQVGHYNSVPPVAVVPRPVPAQVPKIGEPVFCHEVSISDNVIIGVVSEEITFKYKGTEKMFEILTQEGKRMGFSLLSLKPFSPEKIGLPWEEI